MPYERHVDQYNNFLKSYEEVYFTRKNCILVYGGLKYKNTNKNVSGSEIIVRKCFC